MAQTTKQASTSNNQRLMTGLALNVDQVASIYRAADERKTRAAVDAIALKCELMDETAKQATRARLLAMVPPPPPQTVDLDSLLGALDGIPDLPVDVPATKPNRKPKPAQTSTATVAGERVYYTAQQPVNTSTKRRSYDQP